MKEKLNTQPRVPAGSSEGGQWKQNLTPGLSHAFPSPYTHQDEPQTEENNTLEKYLSKKISLDQAIEELEQTTTLSKLGAYNWIAFGNDPEMPVYPDTYTAIDDNGTHSPIVEHHTTYARNANVTFSVYRYPADKFSPETWSVDAKYDDPIFKNRYIEMEAIWEGERPPTITELREEFQNKIFDSPV